MWFIVGMWRIVRIPFLGAAVVVTIGVGAALGLLAAGVFFDHEPPGGDSRAIRLATQTAVAATRSQRLTQTAAARPSRTPATTTPTPTSTPFPQGTPTPTPTTWPTFTPSPTRAR